MTELNFKGKEFVYNHHLSVPFRPLIPHADKGIGEPDLSGNLIIQGDNLHGLKSLLPLYASKVDCIFIDPPYNTGNEGWAYNDNVNAPMIKEWLEANPIGIDDGLRHDKWCAMMWPRLRLLYELLADEGSIWITLDSNEMHRAKLILDEIFGQENLLGTLVWEKSDSPRMDAHTFSSSHDFILVYAKSNAEKIFNKLDSDTPKHYNQQDSDGRQYYTKPLRAMGGQGETREARPNLYYPMIAPDKTEVYPKLQDGSDGAWRWSKTKTNLEASRIEWRQGKSGWVPYFRIYADTSDGRPPETIWYHQDVGSSRTAKAQLKSIFGDAPFDTPKPIGIIERIIKIATSDDSIILDSFSGSGTTAHAVMRYNKQNNSNRKFILVEMEDYADKLTAERVRRVIKGYDFSGIQKTEFLRKKLNWGIFEKSEKLIQEVEAIVNLHGHEYDKISKIIKDNELIVTGEKSVAEKADGLGGSFTYCTLGDPLELDAILQGKNLPSFEALGSVLYHMATNQTLDNKQLEAEKFYLGETESQHVWLIYRDDVEWLKSPNAALTLSFAQEISKSHSDKSHLVFAPARFASSKVLSEQRLNVEFVPLPFALYRLERD